MVVTHNVKGWEEFTKKMEELETGDTNNQVHVLFSGGKDENGQSWCPYCVKGKRERKGARDLQLTAITQCLS